MTLATADATSSVRESRPGRSLLGDARSLSVNTPAEAETVRDTLLRERPSSGIPGRSLPDGRVRSDHAAARRRVKERGWEGEPSHAQSMAATAGIERDARVEM